MKLDVREAAHMLNVSATKIYRWVDAEVIPFVMNQRHPMFLRVELLEWAMEMEIPISADLYEDEGDIHSRVRSSAAVVTRRCVRRRWRSWSWSRPSPRKSKKVGTSVGTDAVGTGTRMRNDLQRPELSRRPT
jgi:excisionase family DNA binding protein